MADPLFFLAAPDPFPICEEWLAQGREEPLDAGRPIVDAHHHLWHRHSRFMLDELLGEIDCGHNIVSSVHVQANSMYRSDGPAAYQPVGETEFVNGIAAIGASGRYGPSRFCEGIIGYVDLRLHDEVDALLDAHIRVAGERFKGVRNISQWDEEPLVHDYPTAGPNMLVDPDFRKGFARLAMRGLIFESFVYHPQLPCLAELADAFPQVTIIVDHVGGLIGVGRYSDRPATFAIWSRLIRELARRPNVIVKFGGLGMTLSGFNYRQLPQPPSSARLASDWKPYFEVCLEAFGAGRIMFESNFPPDKSSYSYSTLWNAFKRLAGGCSENEKAALFGATAQRVYHLRSDPA